MSVHEEWLRNLAKFRAEVKEAGMDVALPPPSMLELGLHYLEVKPGVSMKANLPFQDRFTNPLGTFQGGILAAGLDDVFGPLSYVTSGRPCMTLSLNTTFLKPFTMKMGYCVLEVLVLQKTKSFIFMRGEARSPEGELLAHAESHVAILRDDQMKRQI
jgi:acyl-coenzyme A thioesterase PaaI-like protein